MCLLCISEGSGPPHLICFLVSVIILQTQINKNRQIFFLLLLLLRQPFCLFVCFDGPKPLFFFLKVKSSILLGLNRKIFTLLKLKHFCLDKDLKEGFFFLTVLNYYKAETNFKTKLCFLVKKQTISVISKMSRYACSAAAKTTC